MSARFTREFTLWAGILSVLFVIGGLISFHHGLIADSLLKTIQAYSLIHNDFQSESLYYPARDFDPSFDFFIFQDAFLVELGDRYLGVYPVFLSFILSPFVLLLGVSNLVLVNFALYLGTLAFLRYYWKLPWFLTLFAAFGTYYLPLSLDVSENMIMVFMNLVGVSLVVHGMEGISVSRLKDSLWIVSGAFLSGVSVWLRLEAILFMASFLLVTVLVYGWRRAGTYKRVFLAGIAFSIPVVLFFVFNALDYGHILGPRFFQVYEPHPEPLMEQLRRFLVLTFAGSLKIGLLAYIPVFAIVLGFYAIPKNFSDLSEPLRILYLTSVLFILLIGFTAPNDGATNVGPRYLSLVLFPLLILLFDFYQKIGFRKARRSTIQAKIAKWFMYATISFSFLLTFFSIAVFSVLANQMKSFQEFFRSTNTDVWIMDRATCGFAGKEYFQRKILCLHREDKVPELVEGLKVEAGIRSFAFIESPENMKKNLERNQGDSPEEQKERRRVKEAMAATARFQELVSEEPFTQTRSSKEGLLHYSIYKK